MGRGFRRVAVGGALALLVAGCTGNMDDLHKFVADAKSAPKRPIEPLPEIKPHETFAYEATNLRDPFAPISFGRARAQGKQAGAGSGIRPDENRPKEALEQFPLDSLRMVGTLEQGGATWALVRASDGAIHRVTTGNYMGQNNGKITRITETKIQLREIVPDGLGNYMERQASLALSE
jgi:type IV pilus assembly protein PilP